jgi:hypothetical protein
LAAVFERTGSVVRQFARDEEQMAAVCESSVNVDEHSKTCRRQTRLVIFPTPAEKTYFRSSENFAKIWFASSKVSFEPMSRWIPNQTQLNLHPQNLFRNRVKTMLNLPR